MKIRSKLSLSFLAAVTIMSVAVSAIVSRDAVSMAKESFAFDVAIQAKMIDSIFTTKEVGKGTGQGLNIAYAVIVQKHSGTINVDSTPGEGSCFTIRLPIQGVSSEEASEAA